MARTDRIDSLLLKEISNIIMFEINDPKLGFTTVSEVKTAPDLSIAKVFVSIFGKGYEKRDGLAVLRKSKGFIKSELAHRLNMRKIPDLIFVIDDSLEKASRIDELIEKYHRDE